MRTIFFVCDEPYLLRHGLALVASCLHHGENVTFAVYDPTDETDRAMGTYPDVGYARLPRSRSFGKEIERVRFLQSHRFRVARDVVEEHDGLLVLDADALVRAPLDWSMIDAHPLARYYALKGKNVLYKTSEGFVYVRNDEAGRSYLSKVIELLDVGFNDVRALRYAKYGWDHAETAVPHSYCDFRCEEGSAIWLPLQGTKNEGTFVDEQRGYLDASLRRYLETSTPEWWTEEHDFSELVT